jgi:glutaminyl-peptide cyclotransferase
MLRYLVVAAALAGACACLEAAPTSGTATQQSAPASKFDGTRALEDVRQLVAIGPRVSGSLGAQKARDYITAQMKALGLTVIEQPAEVTTPLGKITLVNLRVILPGGGRASGDRLIVAGHYDTKLFKEFSFVGANDGGSSAAFLIELARALKGRTNALPIELLFLDAEEAVVAWQNEDHTYGSRYYVQSAQKDGTLKEIKAFILVDMIGDRDLHVLRESASTAWLTETIWSAAKRIQRPEFEDRETPIEDDHVPFLQAGIPAVDIIDLDYPDWHKPGDTVDKLSAKSLQAVGDVLLAALPDLEARLRQ